MRSCSSIDVKGRNSGVKENKKGAGAFGILFKLVVNADPSFKRKIGKKGEGNSEITFCFATYKEMSDIENALLRYANNETQK